MMQLSMTTYVALLWGISALFSVESMSASIPETSSMNSTAEPNTTTKQPISVHVAHNETETNPATLHPTHRPAEVSVAATAAETVSSVTPTVESEEAFVTYRYDSSNDSMSNLVAMTTGAATVSSSGPQLLHTSAAVTAAADGASHNMMISETATPTEDQLHQQPSTPLTDMTSSTTTGAASLAAETVSLPGSTPTHEPEVTSNSSNSSTTSPADSTQTPVFIQNINSSSASTTSMRTVNPTSEAAPVSDSTNWPVTINETTTKGGTISLTSQAISVTQTHTSTSEFTDKTGSNSTTEPPTISTDSAKATATATATTTTTNVSTTANISTSPAGIFIPNVPKRMPIPTTKSTPKTTISKSPPSNTEVQPCSTRGVVKHCLIAIASLAGLATIFMVSTIVLCTKLSANKYKVKKPQQDTEMICISALLPERNYTYTRQRNPVTNGVLVIHGGGDSDEDGGDNLTLSSFLPDNDRYV